MRTQEAALVKKQNSRRVLSSVRKGGASGEKFIKMGTGRKAPNNKLYYIRRQLRSGKAFWSDRVLREEELTSLRAQEVELVKKQNIKRGRGIPIG